MHLVNWAFGYILSNLIFFIVTRTCLVLQYDCCKNIPFGQKFLRLSTVIRENKTSILEKIEYRYFCSIIYFCERSWVFFFVLNHWNGKKIFYKWQIYMNYKDVMEFLLTFQKKNSQFKISNVISAYN